MLALLALLAVGVSIQWQEQQAQRRSQAIMENGLESILAANSLQELIHAFERVPQTPGRAAVTAFKATAARFEAIIAQELRAREFFPGEKEELQRLRRMLARYQHKVLSASVVRTKELAELKQATVHFQRINQQGMKNARHTLEAIAFREQSLLWISIVLILCGWLSLAYLLAQAIARPLKDLTTAVLTMPEGVSHAEISFGRLTPIEIEQLAVTLKHAAHQLEALDRLRQAAEAELRSALEREYLLNNRLDEQVLLKTQALAQANSDLLELVSELRGKDRQKAAFLATVSHELRTPLAIIQATVQTLQNPRLHFEPQKWRELLQDVTDEVYSLSALVEDLLDVARMNASTFSIRREEDVDINLLVRTVTRGFTASMAARGLRLELNSGEDLPLVTVDSQRICQILRNLLDNAAKHAPHSSLVRLSVVHLCSEDQERWIDIRVEDAGQGIPDAIRPQLFEHFVRGSDFSRPGLGLGLAIARELVEAHGGKIGVETSSLGGSCFWFQLPVKSSH